MLQSELPKVHKFCNYGEADFLFILNVIIALNCFMRVERLSQYSLTKKSLALVS